MGLYQRRAEILRPTQNDRHFLLSLVYTPEQRAVLEFVAGITAPASIKYAQEKDLLGASVSPEMDYVQHVMPDKISLNLAHAAQANVWTDVKVILKTLARIAGR